MFFIDISLSIPVFGIDVDAGDGIDDPFGNIGGMVAYAFEIFGDEHEVEGAFGELFVLADALEQGVFGAVEEFVHFVVRLAHLFGEFEIGIGEGEDGVWTYSGFTVYTYRENGVETVEAVS